MQELNTSLNVYAQDYTNRDNFLILYNAINEKFIKYPFKCNDLISANEHIIENKNLDSYTSIASYSEPSNNDNFIVNIYEHCIDLDQHESIINLNVSQAKDFIKLLEPYFNKEMPQPSYITYTGRGIHIHIKLINASDKAKWRTTQTYLMERIDKILAEISKTHTDYLLALEVDTKCKNPSRVYRTPGTLNTKANKYSREIYRSNAQYTQDEICNKFNLTHTIKKGINKGRLDYLSDLVGINQDIALASTQYQIKEFKPIQKGYTALTLADKRINDLYTYIRIQNKKGINEGYRNALISIATPLLALLFDDNEDILQNLILLNNEFNKPLRESELKAWLLSWLRKPKAQQHQFKTKTIIAMLNISLEEQEQMKALISNSLKCKRYMNKGDNREVFNAKNRIKYKLNPKTKINQAQAYQKAHPMKVKAYKHKHYIEHKESYINSLNNAYTPIKAVNKMNKAILKAQAHEMRAQGMKYREIAKALNISLITAKRYVKEKEEL